MTPLIDVVFLLLVFFVWTASFQSPERWLPGSVSAAQRNAAAGSAPSDETPPPEADFDQVIVRIRSRDEQLQWAINDQPIASLAAVEQHLVRIAKITPSVPVILHPDPAVPLGAVIDAYDHARRAGFPKIQFAASVSPAQPTGQPNSPANSQPGVTP